MAIINNYNFGYTHKEIHPHRHSNSMTDPAQRAESVKVTNKNFFGLLEPWLYLKEIYIPVVELIFIGKFTCFTIPLKKQNLVQPFYWSFENMKFF